MVNPKDKKEELMNFTPPKNPLKDHIDDVIQQLQEAGLTEGNAHDPAYQKAVISALLEGSPSCRKAVLTAMIEGSALAPTALRLGGLIETAEQARINEAKATITDAEAVAPVTTPSRSI